MNTETIHETTARVLSGSISFPEVVRTLLGAGVEAYHVDYVSRQKTYYGMDGSSATTPLSFEGLPPVAEHFDAAALKAAIFDSQQRGQQYREFTHRAMRAGVQGYIAFLQGQRVTYWGRRGDQHTEWFPGASRGEPERARQ